MCFEADECRPGSLECHGIPLLVPILFPPVVFSMQLLDRGHHPYISTGLVETIFTPLVSVLFMVCQMHIMKIKSLIPGTHEPHSCKLSLQAYKH